MDTGQVSVIVLGGVNYGESHRIVDLLSSSGGRQSAMVYRARSPKSRFGRFFDLGNRLSVTFQKGRGDLPRVVNASVEAVPNNARNEVERLALMTYACEVVSAFTIPSQPAPKMYRLIVAMLATLEMEETPTVATLVAFDAKVLTFSGQMPALSHCVQCGVALEGDRVFFMGGGGVAHAECGTGDIYTFADFAEIEALRRTSLADTVYVSRVIKAPTVLTDFLEYTIGRSLRSRLLVHSVLTP